MKKTVFRYIQPVTVALIVLLWGTAPKSWLENQWTPDIVTVVILAFAQMLEFINERHAGWRMNWKEFLTDLFYVILFQTVIVKLTARLNDEPLGAAKHALGISTPWTMNMPFVAQVAFVVFVIEFGQYWMHRLMHNTYLFWLPHAPHHHITQLNALKGAVGNPLELFLITLSAVALFDLPQAAWLCALNVITAVPAFAHANVRFDPPRWYSFFFTTVEHHSLHHSVPFEDTRCNYANSLILVDRMCGTFREEVGSRRSGRPSEAVDLGAVRLPLPPAHRNGQGEV